MSPYTVELLILADPLRNNDEVTERSNTCATLGEALILARDWFREGADHVRVINQDTGRVEAEHQWA